MTNIATYLMQPDTNNTFYIIVSYGSDVAYYRNLYTYQIYSY